jgi:iron(III) transport system permease protein
MNNAEAMQHTTFHPDASTPLLYPQRSLRGFPSWESVSGLLLALLCLPLLTVLWLSLGNSVEMWTHLSQTILPSYLQTTLLLMVGAGLGSAVIGVSAAWLTSAYDFPGRALLAALLLLPLAVPAYLLAYVWTDLLEYAGPLQRTLRDLFGFQSPRDYWFPEIRSLGGAMLLFSLVLYPYVFLLARTAFLTQSLRGMEAGRLLGSSMWNAFWRVSLPLARPAIIVGLSLVMMEALADYGTVSYFGLNTLSKGVFDVWLNMNDMPGASQLAGVTLLIVFGLLATERWSRRNQRFVMNVLKQEPVALRLAGPQVWLVWGICLLPVTLGFGLPVGLLARNAWAYFGESWNADLWDHARHSFTLSGGAALAATCVALLVGYGVRLSGRRLPRLAAQFASMSYAFPGAILALGVLWPLSWFDNTLDDWTRAHLNISTGLLLSGTVFAILFAYVVRFLAVAYGSVDSGFQNITANMDRVPRLFGFSTRATMRKIHLPLLRRSLLTALLIVFVDCMKELPATLILRPFHVDTLATHVYQYASSEQLEQSSLAALLIVLVGLFPVLLLSRTIQQGHKAPR